MGVWGYGVMGLYGSSKNLKTLQPYDLTTA